MGEKMRVSDINDVLKVPAPSQTPPPRHGECVTTTSDTRDTVTTPHPQNPLQEYAGSSKDELQPPDPLPMAQHKAGMGMGAPS